MKQQIIELGVRRLTMKNKTIQITLLALFLLLLFTACNTATTEDTAEVATPSQQTILVVSGSGSTMAVLEGLQSSFEEDTPGYKLELLSGSGSGGGATGAIEGVLDVAAMSRELKDEEAAGGLEFVAFGQSGTAVFTHSAVGITELSSEQMTAIFTGEVTNWSEVGGPDADIILYVRDESDSATSALREAIFGEAAFADSAVVLTSAGDMLSAVEGTENSVGFGTWPAALAEGSDVSAVALDGVTPGEDTYPITNAMGLAFLADRQSDVQPLIDWLQAAHGQEMLAGFDMILTP
jgi:phosphate transport system substrate-binding protein